MFCIEHDPVYSPIGHDLDDVRLVFPLVGVAADERSTIGNGEIVLPRGEEALVVVTEDGDIIVAQFLCPGRPVGVDVCTRIGSCLGPDEGMDESHTCHDPRLASCAFYFKAVRKGRYIHAADHLSRTGHQVFDHSRFYKSPVRGLLQLQVIVMRHVVVARNGIDVHALEPADHVVDQERRGVPLVEDIPRDEDRDFEFLLSRPELFYVAFLDGEPVGFDGAGDGGFFGEVEVANREPDNGWGGLPHRGHVCCSHSASWLSFSWRLC